MLFLFLCANIHNVRINEAKKEWGDPLFYVCLEVMHLSILDKMNSTEKKVYELALPIAEELNLDLWDIRFQKEGTGHYLRIIIDSPDGIGIEDCENMSRAIDPILDEADPISCAYYLEVSSPGLARPLTRIRHYEFAIGMDVRVHTIRPINNERDFTGKLISYENGIEIDIDGEPRRFEKNEISSVVLADDTDLF